MFLNKMNGVKRRQIFLSKTDKINVYGTDQVIFYFLKHI